MLEVDNCEFAEERIVVTDGEPVLPRESGGVLVARANEPGNGAEIQL